ncbi:MAG: hypothetical protein ACLUD2_07610 [Clostridium sp.]
MTAVSEDQTHGHIQAVCRVKIVFVTVDETVPSQHRRVWGAEAAHPKAPGAVEAVLPQGLLPAG